MCQLGAFPEATSAAFIVSRSLLRKHLHHWSNEGEDEDEEEEEEEEEEGGGGAAAGSGATSGEAGGGGRSLDLDAATDALLAEACFDAARFSSSGSGSGGVKALVINTTDSAGGWVNTLLLLLQRRFPHAAIMGGVGTTPLVATLGSGGVFRSSVTTRGLANSVAILAIGGNCPVSALVTRGVEPASEAFDAVSPSWLDEYNSQLAPWDRHKLCLVDSLRLPAGPGHGPGPRPGSGSGSGSGPGGAAGASAGVAGAGAGAGAGSVSALEVLMGIARRGAGGLLMGHCCDAPTTAATPAGSGSGSGSGPTPHALTQAQEQEQAGAGGLVSSDEGNFTLSGVGSDSIHDGKLVVVVEDATRNVLPRQIQFFKLTPAALQADLQHQLSAARARILALRQRVMGVLMFTCSARGPGKSSFAPVPMLDATRLLETFGPKTPLLGSYCNGEIGPVAMAAREGVLGAGAGQASQRTVFRAGRVSLQGFTAVFGIFCLPVAKKESALLGLLAGSASPAPLSGAEAGPGAGAGAGAGGAPGVGRTETSEELARRVCSQLLLANRQAASRVPS